MKIMESKATYAVLEAEHKNAIDSCAPPFFNSMFCIDEMDSWLEQQLPDDERFELLDDGDRERLSEELREYALKQLTLETFDNDYPGVDEQDN